MNQTKTQQNADEIKSTLKSRYDAESIGDVPRSEIFTRVHERPTEIAVEWLKENYNVKEIAYIADEQLDFLEHQAGIIDRPEGIKWDDPEEGSNIMSSDELAELAVRLGQAEDKVRRIKSNRDTYSHRAESRQNKVERLEKELADYKNAGRLHHLKRLVLG